jgi:hypothetical protein
MTALKVGQTTQYELYNTHKAVTAASVPTPSAGYVNVFIDSADNHVKQRDSAGTVTDLTDTGSAGSFSGVRAYPTASTSLPSSFVETAIEFAAEDFDTDNYHDNVTNNTRLTAPVDGKYLISANLSVSSSAAFNLKLYKNGVRITQSAFSAGAWGSYVTVLDLVAGDYIEMKGSVATATTSVSSKEYTNLSMFLIAPVSGGSGLSFGEALRLTSLRV